MTLYGVAGDDAFLPMSNRVSFVFNKDDSHREINEGLFDNKKKAFL